MLRQEKKKKENKAHYSNKQMRQNAGFICSNIACEMRNYICEYGGGTYNAQKKNERKTQ